MLGAVSGTTVEDMSNTWEKELWSLEKENSSEIEKQCASGRALYNAQAVDEDDLTNAKTTEFESLLEASEERNLRSIHSTHVDYPCHCLAQTVWYREKSNLSLIWYVERFGR